MIRLCQIKAGAVVEYSGSIVDVLTGSKKSLVTKIEGDPLCNNPFDRDIGINVPPERCFGEDNKFMRLMKRVEDYLGKMVLLLGIETK